MKWKIIVFCLWFLPVGLFSQEQVSLLFAGDVMQHGGQIEAAYNKNNDSYDYKDCFKFVKPIISKADIAIANLEVTHAGKPYKGYPQFSAPPQLSEALVDAGFDVILTSNNHSCDGGSKGIIGTLDVLDKLGVRHTGTFRSQKERDASYPLIVEKNGFRIAVLNYTYGTNGLSVAPPLIVNYIDSAVMKADFAKARSLKADYVICTMHWGEEYQSLPNDYQKKWEAFCYRQGADMVIGGHPHVLQPIEQKTVRGKEKLTVWSLGNYVSNQRDRYKDGGIMVRATLQRTDGHVEIDSSDYIFTWVYPRAEGITKPFYILPDFAYNEYNPHFLDTDSKAKMQLYFSDSRALFAKHNKRIRECRVDSIPEVAAIYRFYMKGYYTVLVEESKTAAFQTPIPAEIRSDFHPFTTSEGKYALLHGMYETPGEAAGNVNFLSDVGIPGTKVVFIQPNELTYRIP